MIYNSTYHLSWNFRDDQWITGLDQFVFLYIQFDRLRNYREDKNDSRTDNQHISKLLFQINCSLQDATYHQNLISMIGFGSAYQLVMKFNNLWIAAVSEEQDENR
jgi:hypothetical protein